MMAAHSAAGASRGGRGFRFPRAVFLAGEGGLQGSDLTVTAFNLGMPGPLASWSGGLVVIASLVFGFTTLIGWSYYGQICFEYLFGMRIIKPYRITFVILLFFGALFTGKYAPIVTNIGDITNAAMALPNLIALILLSGVVRKFTMSSYRAGTMHSDEVHPMEHSELTR